MILRLSRFESFVRIPWLFLSLLRKGNEDPLISPAGSPQSLSHRTCWKLEACSGDPGLHASLFQGHSCLSGSSWCADTGTSSPAPSPPVLPRAGQAEVGPPANRPAPARSLPAWLALCLAEASAPSLSVFRSLLCAAVRLQPSPLSSYLALSFLSSYLSPQREGDLQESRDLVLFTAVILRTGREPGLL